MSNFWCILIPILAAIIGAILGWLLRHLTCNCNDEKDEIKRLKGKISKLEDDLESCLSRKPERIEVPVNKLTTPPVVEAKTKIIEEPKVEEIKPAIEAEPSPNFDAAAAKAVFGKKIIVDDLKVVEGIGPKIEQLFKDNGIKTWYQLSKAEISRCQEILNIGGKRYEIHNPGTWPQQAGLAFEGKWDELNTLQDRLDGGVDRG